MKLSWKKFQASEIDELLRMMEQFARVASLPWDPRQRRKNIAEFKQGEIWFVCEDDCKIGYVVNVFGFSFELGGPVAFIDEFYIEESRRRSGIGGRTLEFISKDVGTRGFAAVLLEASDLDSGLHAFYEKSGFARRGYRLYCRTLRSGMS
jgi:GNAT superfamily N-acetyltransferase